MKCGHIVKEYPHQEGIELLSINYKDMNELGKEKLRQVSEQVFRVWKTVNEKNADTCSPIEKTPDSPI